jgi:hypothetical protein
MNFANFYSFCLGYSLVANGCTDDTVEVAASFGPAVRVLTLPVACKQEELTAGDRAATGFPRIYVDADIELRANDVRALASALWQSGVHEARLLATLVADPVGSGLIEDWIASLAGCGINTR